jgi:hypothetical protein
LDNSSSVTVPDNAWNTGDDVATVTVQSDTDATVSAQAEATTTSTGVRVLLPLVQRQD